MGVISIRFNQKEERILKELSEFYAEDRSKLVKKSIMELYETLIDCQAIERFEVKEEKGKVRFHSAEEIQQILNQNQD
jgi:hypothetical protein